VLLAIDARNRAISIGFRDAGKWAAKRHIAAAPARSADEYEFILASFAERLEGKVDEAWMSSVVPSLARPLREAVGAAFGVECRTVGPGVRTGVRIRTDIPSEVGSDLVCAAAAAADLARGPAVVVHFDAAVAFSALGRSGDFLGAAIAPGFYTGIESLRASAALLPEVALAQYAAGAFGGARPEAERAGIPVGFGPAIGKNTIQAVRAGMTLGYAGLVERLARAQSEELVALGEAGSTKEVALLGSGGEEGAAIFAELGKGRFVPDLALEGLALIASRQER
jgi:type III pantothenate kinase